jgi:hypothetical protein
MEDSNDQQWVGTPGEPMAVATAAQEVELITLLPDSKKSRKGLIAGAATVAILAAGIGFAVVRSSGPGVISLAKSAQLTERQHSARVEMTMNLPLRGLANEPILATGLYDFDRKLTTLDMDMTEALGSQMPSTGDPDAGKATMKMQGLVAYMKLGLFDMVPNLKDKWIKMDIGSMGGAAGVDIAKATQLGANDPSAILEQMKTSSAKVETIGKEDVQGLTTTHYQAKIDIEKFYRDRNAVVDETKFAALLELYTGSLTVDAWIDEAGLVRRIHETIPMKAAPMDIVMGFSDFGTPVSISLPADADVVDQSALAETEQLEVTG